MIKILDVKLAILLVYQNIKTLLQKAMFQIGLKKFLWLKKLKTLCRGHMLLAILTEKKLLECFTKKELEKTNQNEFIAQKVIKRKRDVYRRNGMTCYDNSFISWIDKKPYTCGGGAHLRISVWHLLMNLKNNY